MFVVLMVQANGEAAVAVGSQVDTASPMSLLARMFEWATDDRDPPPGPRQQSGTAAGRDSKVGAADTRATGGNGRPPGKGRGALEEFAPKFRERKAYLTGEGMRPGNGFDARTGKRRPDMATAYSETLEDAGGRLKRTISSSRMNYRKPDGSFAEIDPALREEGGRYRQKANDIQVDLARRADDPSFSRFAVDEAHAVSASMDGAAASPAVVEGQKATYVNAFRSTDVELLSLEDGIKETLILKSADAPTRFVFPLTLTGLTARLSGTGAVEFVDADGKVRALTPRGFMEDSNIDPGSGEGAWSDAVTYRLIDRGGLPALEVVLNRDWVRHEARKFPVRVDPSYTRVVSGDTFADKFSPNTERSTATTLAMGTYDNGTHLARSYFKFASLLNPPAGQHTTSVTLNVFLSYQGSCAAYPFDVHPITQNWAPNTLTWNNAPSLTQASIGSATPAPGAACSNAAVNPEVGTWVAVPLTASVFDAWSPTFYGLALKAPSNTGTTSWKRFSSAESTKDAYVSITYAPNVAPQVDALYPDAGASVFSLRPELMAIGHDPDAYPSVESQYQFQIYGDTGLVADSGLLATGVRSWIPPPGVLAWNKTYSWLAVLDDGPLTSPVYPNAPLSFFTTTVPQPLVTSTLGQNNEQGFDPNIANYTTSETDAQVATHGPPLAVARSYNSRDPRVSGAFGAGWSSLYDLKVSETRDAAGTLAGVVITYPEGVEVGFGRNPDGSWAAPLGRFATLVSSPAGSGTPTSYELVDKNGTTYLFSKSLGGGVFGISQILDARGFTETFTYLGNTLTQVQSASGRTLSFGWQAAGINGSSAPHVSSVTTNLADPLDPTSAQVWTYGYTGDRLDTVCPPTPVGVPAACTGYSYTNGSGYSTTVLDLGPRTYLRLREAAATTLPSGRVIVSDDVVNNQGSFDATVSGVELGSAPGPLSAVNTTAAVFDGNDAITVPWDVADNASAQSIALWFKTGPAGAGGVLYGWHNTLGLPGTTGAGTYSPALYIGTDGKLRGQFYSGGASVPITTAGTVTDNAWHFAVLTVNSATQKLYVDGTLVGTLTGQPAQVVGRPVATIGAGYLGGLWPAQAHYSGSNFTGYLSRFTGQIAEVADFTTALTATDVTDLKTAAARTTALLGELATPEGRTRAVVEYDVAGATVDAVTDANGGRWELLAPTVAGSSVGYRTALVVSNPSAYWRLADQGGAQANDEAAFNYANYDNVTLGAQGPFGAGDVTAATFNGSTSQMRSPVDVAGGGATALSISMWFKTSAVNGPLYSYSLDPVSVGGGTSQYNVPALYVGANGRLQGHLWNGYANYMSSPGVVNDNQWHHVVLSGSGLTQSLYLDGAKVATATAPAAYPIYTAAAMKNTIGAGFLGNGWPNQGNGNTFPAPAAFFNGTLAEVAVFNYKLTDAQVTSQREAYLDALADSPAKYIAVKHPTGETTTNVYDPLRSDRIVRVINTLGYSTSYAYDTGGFTLSVTDANGNSTFTLHDARGNVASYTTCQRRAGGQTPAECSTELYTYWLEANGLTDPVNDRIKTRRDGRSTDEDDDRFLTSYSYTAFGDLATVTTPAVPGHPSGRVTTTAYVGTGVVSPYGGTQPARLVASVTTPGGAVQRFVYRSNGDLAETISPLNGVTKFIYDGLGRVTEKSVITTSLPDPVVTTYTYDGRDQVLTETGPSQLNAVTNIAHQARTSYTYDDDGNITSEETADLIQPDGDTTRRMEWTYNAAGRVDTFTDARGKVTEFDYNLYGQKEREQAADGQVTEYTYDAEGRAWRTILKNYTGHPDNPQPAADLVLDSRAYDPAGRLASVTDAMGWVTEYTYFDNNLPAAVIRRDTLTPACQVPTPPASCSFKAEENTYDPASNVKTRAINDGKSITRFEVDAADRVAVETLELGSNTSNDPTDRTVSYTYDADDHVTATVTSQAGLTPEYIEADYDDAGNLTEQIVHVGAGTRTTAWTRDDRGLVTAMTDPNTKVTDYINDAAGNQVQIQAPQVSVEPGDGTSTMQRPTTKIGYNTFGEITHTEDPNGHISRTGYDPAGNVTSTTGPAYTPPGEDEITPVTTREYNDVGQLILQTDPLEHQTSYSYDQLGHLVRSTAPGNAVTRFTYTLNGDLRSRTSPTGAVTEATYDFLSRKLTSTAYLRAPAQTHVTSYLYGDGGWLAKQISPAATAPTPDCTAPCADGVVTSYGYDNAGQVTSIIDGAGEETTFSYDLKDRLLTRTLPDDTSSTRTYNDAGDLIATTDKNSSGVVQRTTSADYDNNGWLTGATDARGHTTTFGRDASGVITSQTEPVSAGTGPGTSITSTFGYDAAGNQTRFTDGRGNAFLTTYTPWNLPATRVEPATTAHPNPADRTWAWSYDANARPVRVQAPGGVERERTFDERGNLTGETGTGAEAATIARSFDYDLDDRLIEASAPGTANTYTWDDRGQLRTTTGGSGAASFDYDPDGRMTSRADAAGTTTYRYTYGRLHTITDAATGITATNAYTADSQLREISYSTGPVRTYTYDALQRLLTDTVTDGPPGSPGSAETAKVTYGYDANDNLASKVTSGLAGPANNTYTYDRANRLTSWAHGATTVNYDYDGAGNRIQNGNQTLVYDQRNRLTSKTAPGETTTYTYSPRGTRTATAVDTGSTTVNTASAFDAFDQMLTHGDTVYGYDALGRAVTTGPSADPTAASLSYTGLTNDIAADGTTTYARDPEGALLATAQAAGGGSAPGTGVLALTDTHADVVAALDPDTAAVLGSTGYDPLGKTTATTGTLAGRLGYQSELTDPVTGAVNMLSRWYDPDAGQFLSRDSMRVNPTPASAAGNGYGYLDANPFDGTDPTGHFGCCGVSIKVPNPIPAIMSTVSSVYTNVVKPVINTAISVVKKTAGAIVSAAQNALAAAKALTEKALAAAKAAAQKIADEIAEAKERAIAAAAAAKRQAEKAAERVRKEAARYAKAVAKSAKEMKDLGEKIKSYSTGITEQVTAGLSVSVKGALAAATATRRFIDTHKATLVGIAVGIGVGLACAPAAAATGGLAVPACVAAAGFAGSAATALMERPPTSLANIGHALEQGVIGAGLAVATLGAGRILAPIASKAFAPALSKFGLTPATRNAGEITDSVLPRAAAGSGGTRTAGNTAREALPCNSFAAATPVLMADGSTKPIDQVELGDVVLAADPEQGDEGERPSTQRVTATIIGTGLKQLVDLTVDGTTITATAGHPFWVTDEGKSLPFGRDGAWLDAGEVRPGDRLLEADGSTAVVDQVRTYVAVTRVHNLTIEGVHTYYVLAGQTPVLVHNTNGAGGAACGLGGAASNTTRLGVTRTNAADWRATRDAWQAADYDVLSPDNLKLIAGGRTPRVDQQWVDWFPGDAARMGERISMHHIGGSRMTVPLPASRHVDAHMPGGFRNNPGGPGATG